MVDFKILLNVIKCKGGDAVKKVLSIMLGFIVVFSACSLSFESFASSDSNEDILGEIYFLDTGENGTDFRFTDKNGNEMPKTSPAETGKKK